jgi:hypothetical protein
MEFYRSVRSYVHGRVAKTLGLCKLLAGSIPSRNRVFFPCQKKLGNIYSVARPKAELRSTGNKYNFFSPLGAKRSVPRFYKKLAILVILLKNFMFIIIF